MPSKAIMPLADYTAACQAVRDKLGTTQGEIVSGELAPLIRAIETPAAVSGTLQISANGVYNVERYALAAVAVPTEQSGSGAGTTTPRYQSKTVTPGRDAQTVRADSGYDALSAVTVRGDRNLLARNIAAGVTLFGVAGTLTAAAPSEVPEEYQSYVSAAQSLYGGSDYTGYFLAEYDRWITVGLMFSGFALQSYDSATTEYTATGVWFGVYDKETETWTGQDYRTETSQGDNFVKNVRFSTKDWYYNGQRVYPPRSVAVGSGSADGYTVTFKNGDTVLRTVTGVPAGGSASYSGNTPYRQGYYFVGWNPRPVNIRADTVCQAVFAMDNVSEEELELSWEEIAADAGASVPIGAWKSLPPINMNTYRSGVVRMRKVADGVYGATSLWVAMDVMMDYHRAMKEPITYSASWAESSIRSWLSTYVFAVLPSVLQNAIVPVTIRSRVWDNSAVTYYRDNQTSDKLWIPSYQEVFGASDTFERGGTYLSAMFPDAASRVRTRAYNGAVSPKWWLRSCCGQSSFVCVDGTGQAVIDSDGGLCTTSGDIVLCFCL